MNFEELKKIEQREGKENLGFNLLTNLEGTVKAVGELEGEAWLKDEERKSKQKCNDLSHSIKCALEHLRKLEKEDPIENLDVEDRQDSVFTIYGLGGIHRFFVKRNGDVVFSMHHARTDKQNQIERVKELGFELFY